MNQTASTASTFDDIAKIIAAAYAALFALQAATIPATAFVWPGIILWGMETGQPIITAVGVLLTANLLYVGVEMFPDEI